MRFQPSHPISLAAAYSPLSPTYATYLPTYASIYTIGSLSGEGRKLLLATAAASIHPLSPKLPTYVLLRLTKGPARISKEGAIYFTLLAFASVSRLIFWSLDGS